MTDQPAGDTGVVRRIMRATLAAGLAIAALSGCACEAPKARIPAVGPEVPLVRVKLGDDVPTLWVAVPGPWRLEGDGGASLAAGECLEWTDVTNEAGQIVFGALARAGGGAELKTESGAPIWIRQAVGRTVRERAYRGTLRLLPAAGGNVRAVNVLPVETYLAGVLANELIKSWHVEAYKAQAVAARTYALMERAARARYDFDLYDSTQSQVYAGWSGETRRAWEGVRGTWGVVATYTGADGRPALLKCYYHSTCGGRTASATSVFGGPAPPPLAGGVKCDFCRRSPKYRWPEVIITKEEITDALRRGATPELAQLGPVVRVDVAQQDGRGGRVELVRLTGAMGQTALVRAGQLRLLIGAGKIPSTWFEIEDRGDRLALVAGRGYGHGVGLCQWGAQYLAERGKSGAEILRYYYPKVKLVRAY